jgi:urease accessory protein
MTRALRIGVGGPVGCGKTTLILRLCESMRNDFDIAVVTNDIYTQADSFALTEAGALPADRIVGVATGTCPHTAVRDDTSANLDAIQRFEQRFADLDLLFVESGGDNLAAAFSPELVDAWIAMLDVAGGDDVPGKGGPGIVASNLLIINKTDLAPFVGASLERMKIDAQSARKDKPLLFCNLRNAEGVDKIVLWLTEHLAEPRDPATIDGRITPSA